MVQHEHIEKLHMQAVVSASRNEDEFVKEFLISHQKVTTLVWELLTIELWKSHVFTRLMKMSVDHEPEQTFPCYVVLYHEVTLAGLLEIVLYHQAACEVADDVMLDVADFCCRKITFLISKQAKGVNLYEETELDAVTGTSATGRQELKRQYKQIQFQVTVKAVSILKYIIDHLNSLPLSIMTHLLNKNDMICCFVELIENPPWTARKKDGHSVKFINGKWQKIEDGELMKLTKLEGQVWLSLFCLLMNPDCQRKYEFNSHNKTVVLKIRGRLLEVIVDQLPCLNDLQRYLEHLAFMEPPAVKKEVVLEQVPEMRERLLTDHKDKWRAIAELHATTILFPSRDDVQRYAQSLASTYSLDILEKYVCDSPKCALCGQEASKRCSRCQNEWYCGRECQVKHWTKHKIACNMMTDMK
ncbi:zinc finger MYND domain-containing protein 10-like isoform X2 [Corticium candelabrum]|nr:zinc finger MYND domain-containing protein 10-like isoform X2 [Corticium candelabrum]